MYSGRQEFSFGRLYPRGFGDGSSLVGSRGKTPVMGLEDKVTQKLKQFADIVYRF